MLRETSRLACQNARCSQWRVPANGFASPHTLLVGSRGHPVDAPDGLRICYDSGNVMDYEHEDPISDIQQCWQKVRAFCIKDHPYTPRNQDCGPGLGEIDHYKLLMPVVNTGLDMPLACENIFEPIVPRPAQADAVDALARRAREFLEVVTRDFQSIKSAPA